MIQFAVVAARSAKSCRTVSAHSVSFSLSLSLSLVKRRAQSPVRLEYGASSLVIGHEFRTFQSRPRTGTRSKPVAPSPLTHAPKHLRFRGARGTVQNYSNRRIKRANEGNIRSPCDESVRENILKPLLAIGPKKR